MKKTILTLLLISSISKSLLTAQTCQDASVELTAYVQADPPVITLTWRPNASATQHFVYRKAKNASSWGSVIGTLPGDATQFVDTTVQKRVNYEYRVLRQAAAFSGNGYINAGIEVAAVDSRGIIILAVDDSVADSLIVEINQLISDFEGDGWRVKRINVPRNGTAVETRNMIKAVYNENTTETKALCLLGHVRVPYSGELNPDGHPDHIGAWPADTYYGEMNGTWTDAAVNNTVANDERNRNTPGDGKFDQSIIPSDIELQTGRIDFFNMPSFAASEIQLLRNYLNKDHAYRHKVYTTVDRAIVDDNFGYFGGEAFASTGWKNFGPMVGFQNVMEADYFPTLADSIHQWSYGCGGGWYQGAGGVGTTTDFANGNTKSVFTMLFGSYLGDWDTQDNFLRAPLAQGLTLTNVWSGRPHWVLHHMGLGENIGYSARLTMNNSNLYFASYGARFIHLGLMGDPTLRNDVVAPPLSVHAIADGYTAQVDWEPSPDETDGYEVYMKDPGADFFNGYGRLYDPPFIPGCMADSGTYTFMVRARKLEVTPSGSYWNLSQGVMFDLVHPGTPELYTAAHHEINGQEVTFFLDSTNATSFEWDGSAIPAIYDSVFTFTFDTGFHYLYLFTSTGCDTDTLPIYFTITITPTIDITDDPSIVVSPNPSSGRFTLQLPSAPMSAASFQVIAANGARVMEQLISSQHVEMNMSDYPPGLYTVLITVDGKVSSKKIIIQ